MRQPPVPEDEHAADGPHRSEAVRELIIRPMLDLYIPPQQVRHDPRARTRALAEYEQTLACFGRETLAAAWQQVKATHELVVWPPPGVIARACRQQAPRPPTPDAEERRRQEAHDLAGAYVSRYLKTSHLMKLARREGWSGRLLEYVQAAAWVQAQLICEVRHVGWDTTLTQGLGDFRSAAEAFAAYRETIRKPVERGQPRVHVPAARVRSWQEQCRRERGDEPETTGADSGRRPPGPPPRPPR